MCNINDNHMMYGSLDMKRNKQNFLSFRTIFAVLPPPQTTEKIKIKKKFGLLGCYVGKSGKNSPK